MSQPPLTPLNHDLAAGIARSPEALRLWSEYANTIIQLGNAADEAQLFNNAVMIAEAIREQHPHNMRRTQPEREALDVYHTLFNRRFNSNDLVNISNADAPEENKRATGDIRHTMEARNRRSTRTDAVAHAPNAAPTAGARTRHDQQTPRPPQAQRSMRTKPIQVIEDAVIGPIEKAAKKFHEAQEKLFSIQNRTRVNIHAKNKAEIKASNALRQYLLAVQSKIQKARNNSPHTADRTKDQYKTPIDHAMLQDQLTPYDFDRLHSVSRHDIPSGLSTVEDGRWLLIAKFADPMRRPQMISIEFDTERGQFNAAPLTLDQGLSALQSATTASKERVQAAQDSMSRE